MDVAFCIKALEEALARYGKPGIFNTDQRSLFTGATFTAVFHARRLPSAWMERVASATTCSLSVPGAR
jgi:transposase InsO family protein